METFIVDGGRPLRGEVTPSGNKNSALPILAACLLANEPIVLRRVPNIGDVQIMRELLESLGVSVREIAPETWEICSKAVQSGILDPVLCRRIRASILLAGPMLARCGEVTLPPPGGDVIGRRRVDTHLLALEALGATGEFDRGAGLFRFHSRGLRGAEVLLDEASVTATENAIMAAVTAKGVSIIRNAASEPHVQELCCFLNILGARVENIGSNTLTIHGVDRLHGGDFTIGPDYLEVVSFVAGAVVTRGEIRIRNAGARDLDMVRLVFRRLGVSWETDGDDILVPERQTREIEPDVGNAIPEITVMPWPAFPTDLVSIGIVLATQCRGSVLFHDWMYPSRMFFTDKLVSMGAQIVLCDPHRCIVQGPTRFYAAQMESPDIRAGMALVLAALAANGKSSIRNIGQIDRGYECVDEKLRRLGASIERLDT